MPSGARHLLCRRFQRRPFTAFGVTVNAYPALPLSPPPAYNWGMTTHASATAQLPLHHGACPPWLFARMRLLAREIARAIVEAEGTPGLLARLSQPHWFQSFGAVLGFDWHSSGVTTVACGALKDGLKGGVADELGLYVVGGKGRESRKTPDELLALGDKLSVDPAGLVHTSRLVAKVDNNAVQDGYQLYHHVFVVDRAGRWAVIQQGMNDATSWARRYHWLSDTVESFVDEPHAAVCAVTTVAPLNLVAHEADANRQAAATLASQKPETLVQELRKAQTMSLPAHHEVQIGDILPERLYKTFCSTYENPPADFVDLLGRPGVGAKTLRALSLLGELLYGAPASFRDPARFSFAHGGKDGTPFPISQREYDQTIAYLERAVRQARLGERERLDALRRLAAWTDEQARPSPAPPSAAPLPVSNAPGPQRPVQLGLGAEFWK